MAIGQLDRFVSAGYLPRYDGTTLDKKITRLEFVGLLNQVLNLEETSKKISFKGVSEKDSSYKVIATAVANGYVSGYQDGTFRPTASISKAESMIMLGGLHNNKKLLEKAKKLLNLCKKKAFSISIIWMAV